jgi:hypothetical protein
MGWYVVFRKGTGQIVRVGSCYPEEMADRYEGEEMGVVRGGWRGIEKGWKVVEEEETGIRRFEKKDG